MTKGGGRRGQGQGQQGRQEGVLATPTPPGAAPNTRAPKSAAAKARQLAALRRGNAPLDPTLPKPPLTVALAEGFVKICLAGVPPLDALAHLDPAYFRSLHPKARAAWLQEVLLSSLVADAAEKFHGGAWEDLEPDARLDVALAKHFAELAHYLYTHDYRSADGIELRKLTEAREAILLKLRGGEADNGGAFDTFLKAVIANVGGAGAAPPVYTPPTLDDDASVM